MPLCGAFFLGPSHAPISSLSTLVSLGLRGHLRRNGWTLLVESWQQCSPCGRRKLAPRKFGRGEFETVRVEQADLLIVRQQVPVLGQNAFQPLEAPLQLLGVKSSALAEEGKLFTSKFLGSGTPSLDLDRRRLDNAGHFLAYVYVDGRLLNEELIRAGLAQADLYPGDNQTMHRNFVKAEKEAKRTGRGIWAKQTVAGR